MKGGHVDWFFNRKAIRWVYAPSLQYLNHIDKRVQNEKPIDILG